MATAQILLVVKAPTDVPREAFQSAVESAARAAGVATSSWTYDATPVLLERVDQPNPDDPGFGSRVDRVKSGPWNNFVFNAISSAPVGSQSSAVLSAYRQNLVGVPETSSSVLTVISTAVRSALGSYGEIKSGFKTLRNPVPWDRGIPAAIAISGGGGAGGIVTAAGIFGLLTLGAIYYGNRR